MKFPRHPWCWLHFRVWWIPLAAKRFFTGAIRVGDVVGFRRDLTDRVTVTDIIERPRAALGHLICYDGGAWAEVDLRVVARAPGRAHTTAPLVVR